MTVEDQIFWINNIVAEHKDVLLSADCGKYYAIEYGGEDSDSIVLAYTKEGGTESFFLSSLPDHIIDFIYNDLLVDFGKE